MPLDERRIDIRWRDLDALGHVNQAVYQTYGEEIADAWFRDALGLNEGESWGYVVARLVIDYRSELRQTDRQVIGTVELVRLGTSSVTIRMVLRAASDGRIAAECECVFAVWDQEQRSSRPLTDEERSALESAG